MNTAAMPADTQALEARLEPLSLARLDEVLAIEAQAHPHPWSRRQFTDALASGYRIDLLLGGDQVLGYFVAMRGVEEAHLLNLTVAPAFQRQGWGQILLDALALWARGQGLQWLWLEVRMGNDRARAVYQANGFQQVGLRKRYYPAAGDAREDALVMSRAL
jgi:ribosomal-protein-alanine N-acetyltransferase